MKRLWNCMLWLVAILAAQSGWSVKIAFILEHCLVRGTEIATFDYADYNETLLGNESYIILLGDQGSSFASDQSPEVQALFVQRFGADRFFNCRTVQEANAVLNMKQIDMVYWLANGQHDGRISQLCKKTAIHTVFTFAPQGNACAAVSKWLADRSHYQGKAPYVPFLIRSPSDRVNTLHDQLHIPRDAIVFGRYGGNGQFSVGSAKEAVIELAQRHRDWYFLFLNTAKFCNLSNVLFLDKTWDYNFKERFINTCDAMIHGRSEGETFGLACAEFSVRNKPVITCKTGDLAHIEILGDKALVYTNKEQLIRHLEYCAAHRDEVRSKNWDAFSEQYNPEVVMKQFNEIFVLPLTSSSSR